MSEGFAPAALFLRLGMRPTASATLDAQLQAAGDDLVALFLWGRDCVNCEIAKREMLRTPERFGAPNLRWLQANVYDDAELATRFSLHGVPTFFLFRSGRKLGRITSWPGTEAFVKALRDHGAALAVDDG